MKRPLTNVSLIRAVCLGTLIFPAVSYASTGGGAEGIILFTFIAFGLLASVSLGAGLEIAKRRGRIPMAVDVLLTGMLLALVSLLTLSSTYHGHAQIANVGELVFALVVGSWPYSLAYLFARYIGYRTRMEALEH